MDYFKADNKFIYLEAPRAEFYIPEYYFEGTGDFAKDNGSQIKTIGLFEVGFFEGDKLIEYRILNLPTWIDLFVNDSETREISLPRMDKPDKFRVLHYNKGNKIMYADIIENSTNVESFLYFVTKGKVPNLIPYEEAINVWRKNQELNSIHLGVPSIIEELVLATSYRYKKDPSIKFAQIIGDDKNNVSQYDYTMNNIRQICQYASTFTAMTFEDIDSMITTSLNRTRNKSSEAYSPVEILLKS